MNRGQNIAAWIGIAISLAASLIGYGRLSERVDQNVEAINRIESRSDTSSAALNQINERTARMEAKLEILLPTSAIRGDRR